MLLDANALDRSAVERPFDVCVVGAGPAGITLARALARRGLEVALMEAGGRELAPETQDPYGGDVVGLDYYDPFVTRLRYLGGSSNHWGGRCRHLDAHDFEPRRHHALSGWPIAKADLDPYAAEADAILDLAEASAPDRPLEGSHGELLAIRARFSQPPVRFGEKYHDELAAAARIRLVLHANLVDLRLDDALGTVTAAIFRSYEAGDPGFAVRARHYCLCTGGLENPRILLNARSQIPAGIGNGHDLVGRFFCDHPHFRVGEVLFEAGVPAVTNFAATRQCLDTNEVLNFGLWVYAREMSLRREAVRSASCLAPFTERLAERVLGRRFDCGTGGLREYLARWWQGAAVTAGVAINAEQALNRDSRVLLTEATDDFGLHRLAIDWRLSELDYRTMRTAATVLGAYMAERRIGRVRILDWLQEEDPTPPRVGEDMVGGHHHMCTTRMSDDPRAGVVDRDCRVHGVANLHVGGSSVFATAGHANPTYTIIQLALRLGDHLAATLRA